MENELGAGPGSVVLASEMLEQVMVQQASETAAARLRAGIGPRNASNLPSMLEHLGSRMREVVEVPGRAMQQGVTTEGALPWGREVALNMLGVGGPVSMLASGASGFGVSGGTGGMAPSSAWATKPTVLPLAGPPKATSLESQIAEMAQALVKPGKGKAAVDELPHPDMGDALATLEQELKGMFGKTKAVTKPAAPVVEIGGGKQPSFTEWVNGNPESKLVHEGVNPALAVNNDLLYLDYIKTHFPKDYPQELKEIVTYTNKVYEKPALPSVKPTGSLNVQDVKLTPAGQEGDFFIHGPGGQEIGQITKSDVQGVIEPFFLDVGHPAVNKFFATKEEAQKVAMQFYNDGLEVKKIEGMLADLAKPGPVPKMVKYEEYVNPVRPSKPNAQFPQVHKDLERGMVSEGQRELDRVAGSYTTPSFRGVSKPSRQMPVLRGERTGSSGDEYFSTESKRLADMYAREYRRGPRDYPTVQPLMLDTKAYLTYDAQGQKWSEVNDKALALAHKSKKKGVIMQNVLDEPHNTADLGPQTVYITLDPGTVRSKFARFAPEAWGKNDLLGSFAGSAVMSGASLGSGRKE